MAQLPSFPYSQKQRLHKKMTKLDTVNANGKCYNSFSCVLSVLIIIFVVAAIGWDTLVSKPKMRESIEEIRTEVRDIHQKIDEQFAREIHTYPIVIPYDTLLIEKQEK